jgi:pre-mRNA-processing factor 8
MIPDHKDLKDLEPLGWIHTSPSETHMLSAFDSTLHAKMLMEHRNWDAESSIIVNCSFTTGSCSLSVYKLTP